MAESIETPYHRAQSQAELTASQRPLIELLTLAAPTVAQMASYTVMQFIDRWMLSKVGTLEATAAGTAGISYFCVLGFGFGVLLVINTLTSQSFGRNDLSATGRYLWQGIWFGLAFGLITCVLVPLARPIFELMGHKPEIVPLEASYLRIVALAGFAKLASVAMSQFLLGIAKPTVVMIATIIGILVNLLTNWMLIFGKLGFPALGLKGSAWGINAAVVCELLVMSAYIFRGNFAVKFNAFAWQPRWDMLKTLLRVGVPSGFQLICDITAWMIFMNVIVGGFGTAALSANSFVFGYMHLCFMPAVGVGAAVTALVGKYIGMGYPDLAARRAHLGFGVAAVYMVTAGIVLYVFRVPLIGLFTQDAEVLKIGVSIMIFVALYQIFDAMFVVYVGALRGAGDTLVPAAVQAVLVWAIVVGGGTLMVHYIPQWGVRGPWTLATIFAAILGFYLTARFTAGKWKLIRIERPADSKAADRSDKLPQTATAIALEQT